MGTLLSNPLGSGKGEAGIFIRGRYLFCQLFPQGDTPLGPVVEALWPIFGGAGKGISFCIWSARSSSGSWKRCIRVNLKSSMTGIRQIMYMKREKLLSAVRKKATWEKRNHINKFKGNVSGLELRTRDGGK